MPTWVCHLPSLFMGFSSFSWATTTVYAALMALVSSLYILFSSKRRLPGPRPLPLIGNLHQLPQFKLEEVFEKWVRLYGDVFELRVFSQPMIVLNSLAAAKDLVDKRGSIYSDRPRFVLFSELMGWEHASTHTRYGPRFRKHRRFINQIFNKRGVAAFVPLQEKEMLNLLEELMLRPTDYLASFTRFSAAIIFKITYGCDIVSVDDLFVSLSVRAAKLTVESGSPAASLVDFFPVMRHIPTWAPFSSFKVQALQVREAVRAMMEVPFQKVKDDMKSGSLTPSYTSMLLDECRDSDGHLAAEDEEDIKGSAGTLFAAAEDTTIAVMTSFVLAMVLHPRELKKAQEEMDRVVGTHRLPSFKDRPSLPYLDCLLKEVIRWNPPVPLGMPHRLMEDDVYRGCHLSEGSTVLVNIYAILRDCADADAFRPERYLEPNELPDPLTVIFGFGRRICPGRHMAQNSYWLLGAAMVTAFDFGRCRDEAGREIIPLKEMKDGFIRHPKPFPCVVKPRSEQLAKMIADARQHV